MVLSPIYCENRWFFEPFAIKDVAMLPMKVVAFYIGVCCTAKVTLWGKIGIHSPQVLHSLWSP